MAADTRHRGFRVWLAPLLGLGLAAYTLLLLARCHGYVGLGYQLIPYGLAPICPTRITVNIWLRAATLIYMAAMLFLLAKRIYPPLVRWADRLPQHLPHDGECEGWQWRIDLPLMVLLFGLTLVIRAMVETAINPANVPYGSDWSTFMMSARAVDTEQWRLYNPSKWPLYPVLSAWAAGKYGGDYAQGNRIISFWMMTLSAPGLFVALRLWMGRFTAIGTALIFAIGGTYHYYAYATTSYGLFIGLTLLQAGCTAWAMKSGLLRAYLACGLMFGLGFLAEIKTLSVAMPLGIVVLLNFCVQNRRPLYFYPLALALAVAPSLISLQAIQSWPVKLISLEDKLKINEVDLIRKMHNWQWSEKLMDVTIQDHDKHLPPLEARIQFNLISMRRELGNGRVTYIMILALIGLLAPLLQRDSRGWGARVKDLIGPMAVAAIIASISGAVSLLYMKKYVIHAIPFFLALALRGTWVIADRLIPLGSPVFFKWLIGGGFTAQILMMNLPINGLQEPDSLHPDALEKYVDTALFRTDIREASLSQKAASWLNEAGVDARRILYCLQIHNEAFTVFLDKPPQLYPPPKPGEPHITLGSDCRGYLEKPAWMDRYWLLDNITRHDIRAFMDANPERFTLKTKIEDTLPGLPSHTIWIYLEPAVPGTTPTLDKPRPAPDIMRRDIEAMTAPQPLIPPENGGQTNQQGGIQ